MTARNAMQRLAEEGLVDRHPGRGSFVAAPLAHRRTDRLMTFSSEMARRGHVPSSRLLARAIRPSTRAEAASLELARRRADRRGPPRPPRRQRADRPRIGGPRPGLRARRCSPRTSRRARSTPRSTRAGSACGAARARSARRPRPSEDARLLDIRRGDPLLVERRVILDDDGRRIEATESRYAADRYALDVSFDVEPAPAGPGPTNGETR